MCCSSSANHLTSLLDLFLACEEEEDMAVLLEKRETKRDRERERDRERDRQTERSKERNQIKRCKLVT
jgi:hypothetical protein